MVVFTRIVRILKVLMTPFFEGERSTLKSASTTITVLKRNRFNLLESLSSNVDSFITPPVHLFH